MHKVFNRSQFLGGSIYELIKIKHQWLELKSQYWRLKRFNKIYIKTPKDLIRIKSDKRRRRRLYNIENLRVNVRKNYMRKELRDFTLGKYLDDVDKRRLRRILASSRKNRYTRFYKKDHRRNNVAEILSSLPAVSRTETAGYNKFTVKYSSTFIDTFIYPNISATPMVYSEYFYATRGFTKLIKYKVFKLL